MRKAVLCFCLLSLNLTMLAADGFAHDDRFVTAFLRDQHDIALASKRLTVVEQHSDIALETETDRHGRFAVWLNPGADYLVFADNGRHQFTIHASQILADEPNQFASTIGTPKFSLSAPVGDAPTLPSLRDVSFVNSAEPEDVEDDPDDPDNPNNGGVSVLYGDPPDNGGTNGEDPPPSHRPKAGGVTLTDTFFATGNRLALTLTSDDLSSHHGLIRKLRLVGRFRTTQPDKLFFEQLVLDSELVSDGSALISIQPSAAGTFDLEIEALGDASLNVNGALLAFELVNADENALFAVQNAIDLSFIRVEPKRGRIVRYGKPTGR